jgi:titin
VDDVTGDVTGQDFTATLNTHAVAGTIQTNATGLENVSVAASGGHVQIVITDASGGYTLTGVPHGSTGIVITPTLTGYRFTPSTRTVNNVTADVGGQDFSAAAAPGAPTVTAVTPGDQQLTVAFNAPVTDGGAPITNYEYSTDDGGTWAARGPASIDSPLLIAGLSNGTTYPVRLRAVNATGSGAASPTVAGTPRSTPAAPTITTVTAGDQELTVAFTAPASDGGAVVTNYEYSTDDGATWTPRTPASTASPFAIGSLTNGTAYQVRIRAVNVAGPGAGSNPAPGVPRSLPGAPAIASITGGDQQITVAFSAPASDGGAPITNYEYSLDDGLTWITRTPGSAASPMVIAGLASGTTYGVRLRAVNAAGPGPASPAVNGTPAAPDLVLRVAADDPDPAVGQTITVTITLTNQGGGSAADVTLNGVIGSGRLTPLNITVSHGAYQGSTGTWQVGTLAPGAVATLTFQAVVEIPQEAGAR